MFCEQCGHALNEKMICPICGWQASTGKQQPNIPSMPSQQPINSQQPYMHQSGFQQPNMQQPYMQQSGVQQPHMQQQYGQPSNAQQQYRQQQPYAQQGNPYIQPNSGQPKKAKKWPLFAGIGVGVACLLVGVILFIKNQPVKDLTNEHTEETTQYISTEQTTETVTTEHVNAAPGSKTLMIYIVGSDLESSHSAASDDIDEILNSGYDESSMNVLLYTGGCKDWDNPDIPEDANTISIVKNGDLEVLSSKDASNMGDPNNLTEFLDYCYENYPSEQYELILWNHGGGAFFGYGFDETTNDSLTLAELQTAFTNSPFHDDNKLEFIGFDACLMGNIETAHALSPYANYMIASQESEPGCGWEYSFLNDISSMTSGREMGTKIVDTYMEDSTEYMDSLPFSYSTLCLSVLDLSKTENVETALNDLFAQAGNDLNADTYAKFSAIRKNTKELAADFSYSEGSYDVIDLTDYAGHMRSDYSNEALALTNALSEFVVYSNANEDKINGVSIYHPYYSKEAASTFIPIYKGFDFATNYADYIAKFAGMLTDTNAFNVAWDPAELVPTANGDMSFSVTLTPEQTASLQNAYFAIARKDREKEGNYDLVALSSAVNSDGTNTLTADFDGQIIYMQNDTTQEKYEVMYHVQEKTDSYTRYLLSSILYNDDIQGEDAMYAYFVLEVTPDNPQGQILGAYPIDHYIETDGNELFPEPYEININDYQNVAFGYFSHQFTSEEDLTNFNEADWTDLTLNYNYFPIADGFSPVKDNLLPGEEYYGIFIFEDVQGNRHCSQLVQLQ